MLWTICVILLILWGLGLLTGYTMGGVIHVLLVIAIIVVLIQVIQGRRRVITIWTLAGEENPLRPKLIESPGG